MKQTEDQIRMHCTNIVTVDSNQTNHTETQRTEAKD
jgi:hypothetical protein